MVSWKIDMGTNQKRNQIVRLSYLNLLSDFIEINLLKYSLETRRVLQWRE